MRDTGGRNPVLGVQLALDLRAFILLPLYLLTISSTQ
jgi:hypothetical protein